MTIYMQTACLMAGNPNQRSVLKKEEVMFATRGWTEFAAVLSAKAPDIAQLLARVNGPAISLPQHPTYLAEGEPMNLMWTADECRQLFLGMSAASDGATERAYDFWELLALVCCGINEEGICVY